MYVSYILVIFGVLHTKAKEYVYVNRTLSWTEANDHCKAIGGELSPLDGDALRRLNLSNQRLELWTSIYRTFSPWISFRGCFDTDNHIVPVILEKQSVVDCQYICRNYSHFGISGYSCFCLNDISYASKHASSCNIVCDSYLNCGGQNSVTVYSTVDQSFIADQSLDNLAPTEQCLAYRCRNKQLQFKTEDCLGNTVDHYSCASVHSCSFEPGDICFFNQDENDSFDWAIRQGGTPSSSTGPTSAAQGMYYTYVEASGKSRGNTARLVSNVIFSGHWCLAFKYHMYGSHIGRLRVISESSGEVIWSLEGNQGNIWNQAQMNVSFQSQSKVVFEALTDSGVRGDIAVDDVKLQQAPCAEEFAAMKCSFESNEFTCFEHAQTADIQWEIKQGRTPSANTGPSSASDGNYYSFIEASQRSEGSKAILMSKFVIVKDERHCFTMDYHMYGSDIGSLHVILKGKVFETEILNISGMQGNRWNKFKKDVMVNEESRIYIEGVVGRGYRGDISIDNIIIQKGFCDTNVSWVSRNARCQQKTGSFLIGYENFNSHSCLTDSLNSWMGVFKGKTENQVKDTDNIKNPHDIKIIQLYKDKMSVVWVPSRDTDQRTFGCNIDGNNIQNAGQNVTSNNEGTIIGVAIALIVLLVISSLILGVVVYKRKTGMWIWQRIKNIQTSSDQHVYETPTSSTVANDGYAFIEHIAIHGNGNTEMTGQRNLPHESYNYIEIIANNQPNASSVQGISNIDYVPENTDQTGYENVNVSNKYTSKNDSSDKVIYEDFYEMAKPVTSGDEISSGTVESVISSSQELPTSSCDMNENAKRTTNEYELKAAEQITGELYDHTTDIVRREFYDRKYGQISYNADDIYDHTKQSRNVSANVDDMYDHTSDRKQSNSEEQSQASGFSTDIRADENPKVDTSQYYWKLEEHK